MRKRKPRGLYFEQYEVGMEVVSPMRTVTETDVVQFAGLSGDYNAIHTDAEFAKDTSYGERIAHGLLGLSIASGLADRSGFIDGTIIAFLGLDWQFKAPVLINDSIYFVSVVKSLRAMPSMGGGIVDLKIVVRNQRDEIVQQGTWKMLVKGQPQAS